MKHLLAIGAFVASVSTASAADWVLGVGTSQFHDNNADNGALVSAEVHSNPFFTGNRFSASFMGVVDAHTSGDVFVGAGLSGLWDFNSQWFVEGSVAPGYFNASSPGNDLGSPFGIRLLLGVGYRLNTGDSLSLAVTHKSNASTASRNPGVNAIHLRYRHSF